MVPSAPDGFATDLLQGTDITVHKRYPFSSHTWAWQEVLREAHTICYINRTYYD